MDTNILLASLGLIVGLMTLFFGIMMWMIGKLDSDIQGSHSRIDQLYSMFCDMQREIKDLYKERKD